MRDPRDGQRRAAHARTRSRRVSGADDVGPRLPPERTFAPLAGEDLRVERGRFLDVGIDHDFDGTLVLGVRRFYQSVDDQLITCSACPWTAVRNRPATTTWRAAGPWMLMAGAFV